MKQTRNHVHCRECNAIHNNPMSSTLCTPCGEQLKLLNDSKDEPQDGPKILVDLKYFKAIQKDSEFLEVLHFNVVEEWSGYDLAREMWEDEASENE